MAARDGGGWAEAVSRSLMVAGSQGMKRESTPLWPDVSQLPVVTIGPRSLAGCTTPCTPRGSSARHITSPPAGLAIPVPLPPPPWDLWALSADLCSVRKEAVQRWAPAAADAGKGVGCVGIGGELFVCGLRRGWRLAAGAGSSKEHATARTSTVAARSISAATSLMANGGTATRWADSCCLGLATTCSWSRGGACLRGRWMLGLVVTCYGDAGLDAPLGHSSPVIGGGEVARPQLGGDCTAPMPCP